MPHLVPFTVLLWLTNSHSCFRDKIKLKSGISKKQGDMALLLAHNQGKVYDEGDVVNFSLWLGVTYKFGYKLWAYATSKWVLGGHKHTKAYIRLECIRVSGF